MSTLRSTQRAGLAAVAASVAALLVPVTAAPAIAKPTTPVPVCTATKALLVDVTQDVRNDFFLLARDGRMWARFSYTQRVRIWNVGGRQHCVRKDVQGTWTSVAGTSPGLTGYLSDGVTGTFRSTEDYMWTGELDTTAPTSGHLGVVDAGCVPGIGCDNQVHLLVSNVYFADGYQHCVAVRLDLDIDGGEHGRIDLTLDGSLHHIDGGGDITDRPDPTRRTDS